MQRRGFLTLATLALTLHSAASSETAARVAAIEALGGKVFYRPGTRIPIEVHLHGLRAPEDEDLRPLAEFAFLTDLSLENSAVADKHTVFLAGLRRLKWINAYRSSIGDGTLARLAAIPTLEGLALGETQVTDAGLASLKDLPRLQYLGLRGTGITGSATKTLAELKTLTGLHLGETQTGDALAAEISALPRLEKLWLHDTAVSDKAFAHLAAMKNVRFLDLCRSAFTIGTIKRLREALPHCEILYEKDP